MSNTTATAAPVELFPGIAWRRPSGQWQVRDADWGDFTGATLTEAYTKAEGYISGQLGQPVVMTVALRKPGSPSDGQKRAGGLDPYALED